MLRPAGEYPALSDALAGGIHRYAVGGAPFVEIAVDGDAPVDGGDDPCRVLVSGEGRRPGAPDQRRKEEEKEREGPAH